MIPNLPQRDYITYKCFDTLICFFGIHLEYPSSGSIYMLCMQYVSL
jgi:hypothetical protein